MVSFMLAPLSIAPDIPDAELARLIAGADHLAVAAESALFRRYAPRVELYGLRHLKSHAAAQDLTQQVMVRVLEAIRAGRVEDPARLSSFIFGTCRNVTWDMRRSDERQRKIEREAERLSADVAPPEHSERDIERLFGCLTALPERESTVLRMSYFDDRSSEEIASRLELAAGNVRVIRHRALAKLQTCMERKEAS